MHYTAKGNPTGVEIDLWLNYLHTHNMMRKIDLFNETLFIETYERLRNLTYE